MMDGSFNFPGVTLLITHYNRSSSLERLLFTFKRLDCHFEDIVVADDASKPEQQEKLKALQSTYNFRLVINPVNKRLPGNMNAAQDAVNTPYTFYVQEDFIPLPGCQEHLVDALQIMNDYTDIDYIRFWSFYRYPVLKSFAKDFSETIYSRWNMSHLKFFMYSDNPHLRRNNFLQKFGRYREDVSADMAEYMMTISFMQKKGKGLFYEKYKELFAHENSDEEPSTAGRANWRHSNSLFFLFLRWLYLRYKWLKSTKDLLFLRT